MLNCRLSILGALSFLALTAFAAPAAIDFNRDVRPILSDKCVACHGPDKDKRKAGLRLDEEEGSRVELKDGARAIVPGLPEKSALMARITTKDDDDVMPPRKSGKNLTEAQIETLRTWIAAGAKYAKHWSLVKPVRPPLPKVKMSQWPRNEIDLFILARLEQEGIKPSPEADKLTLFRRAALDVVGIPPSASDVENFSKMAEGPFVWEQVMEALLGSEHYGERWARHWLDLARYADSNGYSIDAPRSIWMYRDWVIRAFNKDMPFDQFTIEQLAGDLLPNATLDQKIATGFHRNTQINEEGGIDKEQFRLESVVDRVNTTGAAFLGLTLGCAQCHDHKFDPISQREYYEMFAFLNNADEPDLALGTPEQNAKLSEHRDQVLALSKKIEDLRQETSKNTNEINKAIEDLEKLRKRVPKVDSTMVMAEREKPRETYIHIKGDFTRHGDVVGPGVLKAVLPLKASGDKTNRLDLARWIVDRDNPLTARVLVNRIWAQYFGRGLVETDNDFGSQGSSPSHPELLDWLACELMENGWSMKHIHRLILGSATYRQSSNARPDLANIDANNYLLARQSRVRLDAEVVRDVALQASGLLNPKVGGPSVFPPQPEGVMSLGQSRHEWKTSTGPDRYRRGLYTYFWRATPHPSLTVFDAPDSFTTCTRRPRSNTPLQSLTLLNDTGCFEFAEALADRVTKEEPDESRRLARAFEYCLSRPPNTPEITRLQKLLEDCRADGEKESWTTVARVLLNLDETVTRE